VSLDARNEAVKLISEAQSSGTRLNAACRVMDIGVRTFERWLSDPAGDSRRGPVTEPANKLSPAERDHLLTIANSAKYRDKSPSQIVPLLADLGEYVASESTFYRVLKAESLMAHRSKSSPRKHARPPEIKALRPNELWSWDITYLPTRVSGLYFYLYFVVDIYSRKIVGFAVKEQQTSDHAADMISKICEIEGITRGQLKLHSDNGKPMKGATMLATLQGLGVIPSFSRPHTSDDNSFSESLFRTLKYCPQYPSKPFATIEEANEWVTDFVQWYNEEQLHSAIKFVTPGSRHRGEDDAILANRRTIYLKAKAKKPERWSGEPRNWNKPLEVFLNRLKATHASGTKLAA